jgi:hypothetical protein
MRALVLLLASCADSSVVLAPVIDLPQNDGASAFPLDQLTMAVAHEGSNVDLASATFTHGDAVALAGVSFGDDLVVHLTGFVGTSEVAYGRTCTVAVAANAPPPVTHLFLSRSVKFADLGVALPELRTAGAAVTYHDGSGLLVGGIDATTGLAVSDIERFDPRTGELLVLASLQPRVGAVAARVGVADDEQVALLGGIDEATGLGAQFVELIEADAPAPRRVQMVSDANMSRVGLTATTLTDGSALAIGGRPPPAGAPVGDVDEVVIANGTALVGVLRATLATPRYGHTATRLGDDVDASVLIAGGRDATDAPVAGAELYRPLFKSFSSSFSAETMNSMLFPRSQHQAVRMPDGSVLIVGGIDAGGNPVATLELFTLYGGFMQVGLLPPNAGVIDFTATTLPDGRVLLAGGRLTPAGPPLATAFIVSLDPVDGAIDVVATDSLSTPRAGHQATLLCDGTVLVSGGATTQLPAERYNPPPDGRR